MSRKIKPARPTDIETLQIGIAMVKAAKKHFKEAGARSTVQRLNKSLKSAEGALRHMHHRVHRAA